MPYCQKQVSQCSRRIGLSKRTYHQRLTRWWATWHVDIHRHNTIATSRHGVTVVVISTSVRTRPHGDNPSWIRHLIINLSQRRSHLVRESTSNNHNVGLTRGSSKNDTESILIVSRSGEMHHFNGAAGKSEGHGPERSLTRPVGDLIESRSADKISDSPL